MVRLVVMGLTRLQAFSLTMGIPKWMSWGFRPKSSELCGLRLLMLLLLFLVEVVLMVLYQEFLSQSSLSTRWVHRLRYIYSLFICLTLNTWLVVYEFWSKVSVSLVSRMWSENTLKHHLMGESMLLSLVLWVVYPGESLYLLSLSNWLGTYFICYIKTIVLTHKWWCVGFKLIYRESEYAAWTLANGYALNHVTISVHRLKSHLNKIKKLNQFLEEKGFKLNSEGGVLKGLVAPNSWANLNSLFKRN